MGDPDVRLGYMLNRRMLHYLDLHPHVHIIVPGGIDAKRKQWEKLKGKYLFNVRALADAKLPIPTGMSKQWVVDCRNVGSGEPALKYLSR